MKFERRGHRQYAAALVFVGAVVTSVVGCANDEVVDPALWVTVGHGLTEFEPLDEGDGVEMVFGPQGGWHIDLGARFFGVQPVDQFIFYRVWDVEHTAQISYPIRADVNPAEVTARSDGSFEQVGIRTVFAIEDPYEVVGTTWLIEAEFIAGADVVVDSRTIVVVDDEP